MLTQFIHAVKTCSLSVQLSKGNRSKMSKFNNKATLIKSLTSSGLFKDDFEHSIHVFLVYVILVLSIDFQNRKLLRQKINEKQLKHFVEISKLVQYILYYSVNIGLWKLRIIVEANKVENNRTKKYFWNNKDIP